MTTEVRVYGEEIDVVTVAEQGPPVGHVDGGGVMTWDDVVLTRPIIAQTTFAQRPDAEDYEGHVTAFTDFGPQLVYAVSDGEHWYPLNGSATLALVTEAITAPLDLLVNELFSYTIPAFMLGPRAGIRLNASLSWTSSVNDKFWLPQFGSTNLFSQAVTVVGRGIMHINLYNRNSLVTQTATTELLTLSSLAAVGEDMDETSTFKLFAQKETASESMRIERLQLQWVA